MKSHLPLSSPAGIGAAAQLLASKSLSRVDFTSNSHHQLYRVIPLYPLDSFRFYFYLLQKHHNIVRFEWNFISKLSDFFQDLAFVPDFLKPVGEYWWCSDGESQDITG